MAFYFSNLILQTARHKNPPRIESQNFIISVSTLRGSYQKAIYDRFYISLIPN